MISSGQLRNAVGLLVLLAIAAVVVLIRPLRHGLLLLLGVAALSWTGSVAYGYWLRWRWRRTWELAGKRILFVYSRSPHWQEYIETNWLPRLEGRVVVLNWSDRATWRRPLPLEVRAFRYWAGDREFNPIAILFPPRGRVRTIRFWHAFRDFKHGKDSKLRRAEQELFDFAELTGCDGRPTS